MQPWLLCSVILAQASAAATPPSIRALSLRQPLQQGAASVDVGIAVEGEASQVEFSIDGTSADGSLVSFENLTLKAEQGAALPFHALVPLLRAFPNDGALTLSARPVGLDGTRGATVTREDLMGIQLIGAPGDDAGVLSLAAAYQAA